MENITMNRTEIRTGFTAALAPAAQRGLAESSARTRVLDAAIGGAFIGATPAIDDLPDPRPLGPPV